jgi:endonuclease/exonuclease/phosphatase family metal-dependent hydrolase
MIYLLLFFCLATSAFAQTSDTIRVCTYNVLNFSSATSIDQRRALSQIIGEINPDILVVQELKGAAGANAFFTSIFEEFTTGDYAMAQPFSEGIDSDNGLFYKSDKVELVSSVTIPTEFREIDGWNLRVKSTGEEFRVYSVHYIQGEGMEIAKHRHRTSTVLRAHLDSLPAPRKLIAAGTFNFYSHYNAACTYLMDSVAENPSACWLFDPHRREGRWDWPQFDDVSTESTRADSGDGFEGGGLAHRFDLLLTSRPMLQHYVDSSYITYGNDGRLWEKAVNAVPNTAVDSATAQALHDASDHLPVYLDLVFRKEASGVEEERVWRKEINLSEGPK